MPRDDEAAEFWRTQTDIDPAHIHLGNKKDNFWEMGDTGPCGPCTEIHIDRTPDKSRRQARQQGRRAASSRSGTSSSSSSTATTTGKLTPLPAKHVDTGMGFERVTAVLQGKASNYDTDVFTPIMDAIGELTGKKYGGKLDDLDDIGFRVIADHLRMADVRHHRRGAAGQQGPRRGAAQRPAAGGALRLPVLRPARAVRLQAGAGAGGAHGRGVSRS